MDKKPSETADDSLTLGDMLAVFRAQHERAHAIIKRDFGQDTADQKALLMAVDTMGAIGQRLFLSSLHMAEALGKQAPDGRAKGPGFEVGAQPKS